MKEKNKAKNILKEYATITVGMFIVSASVYYLMTVSYTHLDVYKRQLGDFGKCRDCRIECTHIIQDTDTSAEDKYKKDDINGIVNTTDCCKEDFKYALRRCV